MRMIRERGAGRPSIRRRGRTLLAGVFAAAFAAVAAPPAAAPGSAGRPLAERLPEAVASAQKLVEKMRGVPFPGKVASAILHEKDLKRVLGQKLVEDLPAPFPRYAASLAAVGFFDPEPLLEQKLTTLYARQVAGFYDPAEKKFFIVPERTAETAAGAPELGLSAEALLEDTLLAHELTHALQDRRLDLVPRLKALHDSSDGLLALEAFLEGEATVVMMDALLTRLPDEAKELVGADTLTTMMSGLAAGASIEGSEGVPPFFVKEMLFPYVGGTAWIQAKRKAGGWAAVDAAYARLPRSTSEILHPDRASTARVLLDPGDRPSAAAVPPGMRLLYEDTFGEWMLGALLERAGAANAASLAAEWQDDRIVFFEPKEALGSGPLPVGFVWRMRVTSPAAAKRIAAALERFYERPDGRKAANVTAAADRVEVVHGRMASAGAPARTISPPQGASAPPEGK
ncbi:MAG TPA: hypothetical protein VLJ18_02655 [Thermoanaerobaculia bacterium]|nr:hypothetical protein [Thermoanaerobaculia bacterium]